MRRLVFTTYLTLDGVFEEPGEWSFPFWNDLTSCSPATPCSWIEKRTE